MIGWMRAWFREDWKEIVINFPVSIMFIFSCFSQPPSTKRKNHSEAAWYVSFGRPRAMHPVFRLFLGKTPLPLPVPTLLIARPTGTTRKSKLVPQRTKMKDAPTAMSVPFVRRNIRMDSQSTNLTIPSVDISSIKSAWTSGWTSKTHALFATNRSPCKLSKDLQYCICHLHIFILYHHQYHYPRMNQCSGGLASKLQRCTHQLSGCVTPIWRRGVYSLCHYDYYIVTYYISIILSSSLHSLLLLILHQSIPSLYFAKQWLGIRRNQTTLQAIRNSTS